MILDFNIVYSLLSKFERAGQEETPSTPIRLVREMLDKLPPEIWSDPSKTFLDPACSTGTFLLEIVRKLNIGLASQMPDQTERLKHILTKQVWGLELSRVPLLMTNAAFEKLFINTTGIVGEVNIYHANALDGAEEIKDMKFDVVVGNPPYQAPARSDKNKGKATGNAIWHKFVDMAISEMLKDDGYLCFVHPAGWRKPQTKSAQFNGMYGRMVSDNHMIYLSIHDTKDGIKTFGAGTRYDWYVIQKGKSGLTEINDQSGLISTHRLDTFPWLPNEKIDEISDMLATEPELNILWGCSHHSSTARKKGVLSKEETPIFKYPVVHSTPAKGTRYFYANRNTGAHFGTPKAIFGESGINDVIIDIEGEYGMTECAMAIAIDSHEDGEELKEYLMGDKFAEVLRATKWGNFRIDWRMFRDFKQGFWRAQNE